MNTSNVFAIIGPSQGMAWHGVACIMITHMAKVKDVIYPRIILSEITIGFLPELDL